VFIAAAAEPADTIDVAYSFLIVVAEELKLSVLYIVLVGGGD